MYRRRARLLSSLECGDRCAEQKGRPLHSPPSPTHSPPSHHSSTLPGSYPVPPSQPPQAPTPSLPLPVPAPIPHHNDGSSWQAIILCWAPSPPQHILFPPRAFKIGGRARQQTGVALTCTRHGRVRGTRADCGEQLVFERRAANGYFIPDPSLFVVTYLNWGGEGGVCKKRRYVVRWECVFTYARGST